MTNITVRAILHFLAAVHFTFSCFYDWNYVNVPESVHIMGKTFGKTNKLKFLTYWDALLQAFFFTVCFIYDLLESQNKETTTTIQNSLKKFKDMLMCCLAFPLSMFVGLTFWALYAVDRELVLPKVVDAFFPWWLNHCMHTNIMIFMFIEMATTYRKYPGRKTGMAVLTSFMLVYLVWIHIIHSYTNMWVYPVLEVLNFPMRMVFFITLLSLAVALYVAGEKLNRRLWNSKDSHTELTRNVKVD